MINKDREKYTQKYWDLKAELSILIRQQYTDEGIVPTNEQIDKVSAMVTKERLGMK